MANFSWKLVGMLANGGGSPSQYLANVVDVDMDVWRIV